MNPFLKQLHTELASLHAEAKTIMALETADDTQKARADALPGLIAAKQSEIKNSTELAKLVGDSEAFLNGRPGASAVSGLDLANRNYTGTDKTYEAIKSHRSRAKFFSQVCETKAEAEVHAFRFGQFLRAVLFKTPAAVKYCSEHGIALQNERGGNILAAGNGEGDNDAGGALVVPEFENDIIVLRELFGIFRKFARYTPMTSDQKSRPRRKGGLVAYHVGSQTAAAESTAIWDRVTLNAKKVMILAQYESELEEDAIVDFGDTLAGEMAYTMTVREDSDGFLGDGTSNYGGIVGAISTLLNIYTTAGGLGLRLGTAPAGNLNHWTALTLQDFAAVKGALPEYTEQLGTIKWFCHKAFFEDVMAPIALSAGGVTAAEIVAGIKRRFMGYDVVVSQIMPNAPAGGQIPVLFGALELAADFGDRRKTTIAFSDQFQFANDVIVAKCTERYDINVHDAGTATAAGPLVGMVTQ